MEKLFQEPKRKSSCRFVVEFSERTDDERAMIIQAFADENITTAWISSVLRENGFKSSEATIRTHRRGLCSSCGKMS